nr:hypothetical protein HUO10_000353 [Paraburkholderia busanensis]
MIRLNKIVLFFGVLIFATSAFAGSALLFQDPYLLAYKDSDKITGIYSSIGSVRSCYFLFYGSLNKEHPDNNGYSASEIETFLPGEKILDFENRDRAFDISGKLYRDDDGWVIRTTHPQAGCASAQGVFEFDPPDFRAKNYEIKSTVPAMGIRIVKSKSFFYDLKDEKFVPRKGYLTKWNGVVVLKISRDFSYVRYVDTGPKFDGRVTFGWLRSNDLVDPFPVK